MAGVALTDQVLEQMAEEAGDIFAFGDAVFGSTGAITLNKCIVGMTTG